MGAAISFPLGGLPMKLRFAQNLVIVEGVRGLPLTRVQQSRIARVNTQATPRTWNTGSWEARVRQDRALSLQVTEVTTVLFFKGPPNRHESAEMFTYSRGLDD